MNGDFDCQRGGLPMRAPPSKSALSAKWGSATAAAWQGGDGVNGTAWAGSWCFTFEAARARRGGAAVSSSRQHAPARKEKKEKREDEKTKTWMKVEDVKKKADLSFKES